MTNQGAPASSGVEDLVARPGGISYLRIPARDLAQSAEFYRAVFGWQLRGNPDAPSFSDGTGHVIGHWRTDLPAAGEAGVRILYPTCSRPRSRCTGGVSSFLAGKVPDVDGHIMLVVRYSAAQYAGGLKRRPT